MPLVKKQIPRAWLLPGPDAGKRLQDLIAAEVARCAAATLEQFTTPHGRMVQGVTSALSAAMPDDADELLGVFDSDTTRVPNYFAHYHFFVEAPRAFLTNETCALVSLMYYDKAKETDDPQKICYVVVYWDRREKIWRLPNERWGLDPSQDGEPVIDTRAPQSITALVFEPDNPYWAPKTPNLKEVLNAFLA